jgi:pimeloyl-ACP methyl ester carboxylesterase
MDNFFPVAPRRAGALVDAYRTTVEVNDYPLEELAVPTLIVHAVDDPLTSYDAAVAAASRIPGARLVSLDAGGHLLLGQTERLSKELDAFLAT